ncbi:MAG: hypothetical protein R3B81_15405 [bacterium]
MFENTRSGSGRLLPALGATAVLLGLAGPASALPAPLVLVPAPTVATAASPLTSAEIYLVLCGGTEPTESAVVARLRALAAQLASANWRPPTVEVHTVVRVTAD